MRTGGKRGYLFSLLVSSGILCSLICKVGLGSTVGSSVCDFYCYFGERKIALTLSKEKIAVRFRKSRALRQAEATVQAAESVGFLSGQDELSDFNLTLLPLSGHIAEQEVVQTVNYLNNEPDVQFANPVFYTAEFDAEFFLTDEFFVKSKPCVSGEEMESLNRLHDVEIAQEIKWADHYILRVKDPTNLNTLKIANLYHESPIIEYSHPNFVVRSTETLLAPMMPNDPGFPLQWALNNSGQNPPGGTPGADMNALQGWEISTRSDRVVIAVIDTGVDYYHEDLAANIWINAGEDHPPLGVVGPEDFDGVDDDENGYTDDIRGWDFYDLDNDPYPDAGIHPGNAHGTACAGLAAAEANNGIGITGVCWNGKIMPIRVFRTDSAGRTSYYLDRPALALKYASDMGADVLSNSWAGAFSDAVHGAIRYAKENGRNGKGCVVVFGSGNKGNNYVALPARWEEVIAVGATDADDIRWCYSQYGPGLDVVGPSGGPGTVLWTTDISGQAGYNPGDLLLGDAGGAYTRWFAGTSAATAEVAGVAGLILSVNPDLTAGEVAAIIESSTDDKGDPGWDEEYGWGRVDVNLALYMASAYPGGALYVTNNSGQTIAWIDDFGNLFLKGTLIENTTPIRSRYYGFRVEDSSGADVAIIDTVTGNMYIAGSLYQEQEMFPASEDFVIRNSSGSIVAYIDGSGHMYLKGRLYQSAE